jgi:hypothetical protein
VSDWDNLGTARPFHRFYKGFPQTDHFYTISDADVQTVLGFGWVPERDEGFVYPTNVRDTVTLYRLSWWNPATQDLMHLYTTDFGYANSLTLQGWNIDNASGVGYVYTAPTPAYDAEVISVTAPPLIGPNQPYPVSVRVMNTGTATWDSSVVFLNQGSLQWLINPLAPTSAVGSGPVPPGGIVDLNFFVRAATPGSFPFFGQMAHANAPFGSRSPIPFVQVADLGPVFSGIAFASSSVITGWICYPSFPSFTKSAFVYFKGTDSASPNTGDLFLGAVPANQPYAPAVPYCNDGNKGFAYGLPDVRPDGIYLKDGRTVWLVTRTETPGQVDVAGGYQQITMPDTRPDRSVFVSQTIPSLSSTFQSPNLSVTMQNAGTNVWSTSTHKLLPAPGSEPWAFLNGGIPLPNDVAPGQSVTFNFTVKFNSGPRAYISAWQVNRSGVPFGDSSPAATIHYRPSGTTTGTGPAGSPSPPSPLPYNQNPPSNPVTALAP